MLFKLLMNYLQNWEFQAYTNLPENSFTRNGALYLKPVNNNKTELILATSHTTVK